MDWNCTRTEERLSDFLEGAIEPEVAAALSAHAAGCAHCTRMVAQVGGLVSRMRQAEPVEEPPHLAARILDATLGPRRAKQGWQGWLAWIPVIWQPQFAMGAVTVAASFLIVFHATGGTPNKLKRAAMNPVNVLHAANRQVHLTYARGVKFVNDLRVVYEIQSRLQPEPAPQATPPPAPPQTRDPRQKSQATPRRGGNDVRSATMLAFVLAGSSRENLSESATRSLP